MKKRKMDNKKYTQSVEQKQYPENPIVPLDNPFINKNGVIQNLFLNSVSIFDQIC